jgi:AraC-like DNA-binding protein
MSKELSIKNMVCDRCIMAVKNTLEQLQIDYSSVTLGKAELTQPISDEKLNQLEHQLQQIGFELLKDKKIQLVEKVKNLIIDHVHHQHTTLKVNLSDYLSDEISMDYGSISKLFSEMEGTTIEKFVIAQKIEKVKELISYNELTLSEIADVLNYSSVAHLSSQFKKVTGLTPTEYKLNNQNDRKPISGI